MTGSGLTRLLIVGERRITLPPSLFELGQVGSNPPCGLRGQPAYALSRSAMTIFFIFIMACMTRSALLRSGSLR
jgi:hypothetical protein